MYKLFSVDDHVIEPRDVWTSRLQSKYGEAVPHVIVDGGREYWIVEGRRQATIGLNAVAGKPREEWGIEPTRFSDMIPGCYDPFERARDLRSNGIYASVNFPTLPGFGGRKFVDFEDKGLALDCVRAWNDWILEDWCAAAPQMFVPMVITPLWDIDLAVTELERCLALGAKALCFVEDPAALGLPGFHTDYWSRLFAIAEEADLPICMHIGSSGGSTIEGEMVPLVEITAAFTKAAYCSVNLMLSPLTRAFPDIKLVWSEGGIGWLPAALERADRQWERHKYWNEMGDTLPSEVCRRSMYFCMIEEPWGISQREIIGVDKILWESDYPHADTPWPNTQPAVGELFQSIDDETVSKITHQNAEKLFHFPLMASE